MNALFCLIWVAIAAAAGHEEPTYLNVNAWEAQKTTAEIIAVDPAHLTTAAEKIDWARARLAAIALDRLQGKEAEALQLYAGCAKICEKYGEAAEWKGVKGWAEAKKKRH